MLQRRYYVGRLLDKGSFGKVFKITDTEDKTRPLAIKIQPADHIFEKEIHAMKSIWRRRDALKPVSDSQENSRTPEIVASGSVIALDANKPLLKAH